MPCSAHIAPATSRVERYLSFIVFGEPNPIAMLQSYAESRLREGIRLGFEHAPRFAAFVCPNPALSALCNPENSGRRAETYTKTL